MVGDGPWGSKGRLLRERNLSDEMKEREAEKKRV